MTSAKYDVLGIGNAIFDVLVQADEGFLARHGMAKGGMALIDEARATAIYRDMGPATEMSGGFGDISSRITVPWSDFGLLYQPKIRRPTSK